MNEVREHCINILNLHVPPKKSNNIEKSIYNFCIKAADQKNITKSWSNFAFEHIYKLKSISVINYIQDPIIQQKLSCKDIQAKDLAFIIDKPSNSNETCNEDNVKDGIFQCRKCGSKKTTYYSLQTRSADEPMTNFITCVVCKNRWKM